MTHSNRARPYLCYIKKNNVFIYKKYIKKNINYRKYNFVEKDWMFTKLVKHYKASKIFIGKDDGKSPGSDLLYKNAIKFT